MASNSIKTVEICKIVPSDSPSQFTLPLTFLDRFWLPLDPASRLFFYKFPEENTDFSNTSYLPKLKKSLSLTLHHYIPVAGHLVWPHDSNLPVIQCNTGDGVSLKVAEAHSDFHALSGNEFRDTEELLALLPDFPTSETQAPVMTLQITLFPNIGFSIGYVAHHGVVDGKSASLFMHSWAYICKYGDDSILPPELTPSFDRSFVEQQSELERIYPLGKPIDPNSKSITVVDMTFPKDVMLGTFRLSRENINTLKNKVAGVTRISTFTVASVYAWLCLIKAKNLSTENAFIGINVDARGRLEPPVSSTYFGNCVVSCGGGGVAEDFLYEDGFSLAVEKVRGALDKLNEGVLKLAEHLSKVMSSFRENPPKERPVGLVVAGSPRFELYKADFGWGRPIKVEMISIAKTGAFYLSDDRDGNGGIELGVALKKDEAQVFKSEFVRGLEDC